MPSYEKSKSSGLWSCRFRALGNDNLIHQYRLSGFQTKQAARFAYEDWTAEAEHKRTAPAVPTVQAAPDPNEITVADLCRKYLAYQKTRVRESSYLTQVNKADVRIIPFFEKIAVNQATPTVIQEWMESVGDLSFSYRLSLFRFLKAACSYGVDYLGTADFLKKIKPPRNTERKKEMTVWSPEQFAKAIEYETDETYKMFYTFLYLTGVRRGEALALTWKDIDLKAGTVRINKSLTIKQQGGGWKITQPKTESSIRTIGMPSVLTDRLKSFRKRREHNAFVFGNGDHPILTEAIRRHLLACAKAAGLPEIRLHDLRHSHASMLISAGVPITAVSKRLGHSNIEQTLSTYSHMMPSDEIVLMRALENEKIGTFFSTK